MGRKTWTGRRAPPSDRIGRSWAPRRESGCVRPSGAWRPRSPRKACGPRAVVLGEAGVSISSMDVDPSRTEGTALMVLSTDRAISDEAFATLQETDGILAIHRITCV